MADQPEVSTPEYSLEAELKNLSGSLSAISNNLQTIVRVATLLMDLERAVFVVCSKAVWGEDIVPEEQRTELMERANKLWYALHESGLVFSLAAADISKKSPELAPEIRNQLLSVDRDFVDGAVRVCVVCLMLGREAPGMLNRIDLDDGKVLQGLYLAGLKQVQTHLQGLTEEQSGNLDIYKLVGQVVRGQPINLDQCHLDPADKQALDEAEAQLKELIRLREAAEQAAKPEEATDGTTEVVGQPG